MKYLLVFAIVLLVLWLWKNKRHSDTGDAQKAATGPKAARTGSRLPATEIVACDLCHVHLPRSEALAGPHGLYCSPAHRQQAGG